MDEDAPVKVGVVIPANLRTQRTFPLSTLQDGSDGLLAVLPEVLAEQVALEDCVLHEFEITETTLNVSFFGVAEGNLSLGSINILIQDHFSILVLVDIFLNESVLPFLFCENFQKKNLIFFLFELF